MVELSTNAYRPTRPIWRDVVAAHNSPAPGRALAGEVLFESRFTASEILDAIRYLRFEQHTMDESTGHLDEDERWPLNRAS